MTAVLDAHWLAAHPLPSPDVAADKNARGRVLVAGGAEFVPGALRLTGEAALRAGAGKLQLATVGSAAMSLAVLVPEAAMIALPADEDGEIAAESARVLEDRIQRCDALVLGPGMSAGNRTEQLVREVVATPQPALVIILDAAAITCARDLAPLIARHEGRVIMTPHHGEMATLAGLDIEAVSADPAGIAGTIARQYNAVILLKAKESVIVAPNGDGIVHVGGCVGLATGGSGDVLAGIVGGLAARGMSPFAAAAWATWAHGRAGEMLSEKFGGVGFLAREILALIPSILNGKKERYG